MTTNKVPRTFCITLKETPLRTKGFEEFAKLAGIDYQLFYGYLGVKLGLHSKDPNSLESVNPNVFMTDGAIGCTLSHISLWKTLSLMPEDEFFIVEDDVILEEGFVERFHEIYSTLPEDWEFVYVGWIPHEQDNTPVMVNENVSIRAPRATHAYLVKKSVLETLCETVSPIRSPLDLTLIKKVLPDIKSYAFEPSLVSQKSYLKLEDVIWSSLVYDWENDLYGCKQTILKEFGFVEGWHNFESTEKEVWRWSKDEFSLTLPSNIDSIRFNCTSAIANKINFICNDNRYEFTVAVGANAFVIPISSEDVICGKLENAYVPSEMDTKSTDNRTLGICLKNMVISMGPEEVNIPLTDLGGILSRPIDFKL